jgi:hypothetical protein
MPRKKKKTPIPTTEAGTTAFLIKGIPVDEHQALRDFSEAIGRSMAWVAQDAINVYVQSLKADAEELRDKLDSFTVDIEDAGHTPLAKTGRPPKSAKAEPRASMSNNCTNRT